MSTDELVRLTADVVLFARRDDELCVLLIRRGCDPYAGCWALPGGHVDPGEETLLAARRELLEETGLHAPVMDSLGVYARPGRDPRGRYVTFVYTATLDGPPPALTAGDDATEAAWWPLTDLADKQQLVAFDHFRIICDAVAA